MKVGDIVNHCSSCFDSPWFGGIIIETKVDAMEQQLTLHRVYWPGKSPRWVEEGLLEVAV